MAKSKTHLFCVTTYSTFRHRYLVEAETDEKASAYVQDTLANGEDCVEWQQKHLCEIVTDCREYSMRDAKHEHADLKDSLEVSGWMRVETFINKVK